MHIFISDREANRMKTGGGCSPVTDIECMCNPYTPVSHHDWTLFGQVAEIGRTRERKSGRTFFEEEDAEVEREKKKNTHTHT